MDKTLDGKSKVNSPYWTKQEVGEYFRKSYSWVSRNYLSWRDKYGVHAHRFGSEVMFDRKEIIQMAQMSRIN